MTATLDRPARRPWTAAEITALRAMVGAGVMFKVIGRRLGRSKASVGNKADQLLIRSPRGWWGQNAAG